LAAGTVTAWRQTGPEKVNRFLKAQICCVMLTTSQGLSMQDGVIFNVEDIPALPLSVGCSNSSAAKSSPLRSRRRIVPFSKKRQIARLALLLPNQPHRPSSGLEQERW